MNPFTIAWRAPEFEYHPKSASWYWASVAVATLMIAAAVWQRNFLFGLFIVIAEILILIWTSREPDTIEFTLNEKGFEIGDPHGRSYPVREIATVHGFEDWSEEWATFIIDPKGHFRPSVRIHAPRARYGEIERAFAAIVPVIHKEESLVDVLERFLGF